MSRVLCRFQLQEASGSLEAALADVASQRTTITDLEQVKANVENELREAQAALELLRSEHLEGGTVLQSIREEVCRKLLHWTQSLM
jgi:chromosome segregation ATPase